MAVSCPEVMYGAYYPYLYGRAGPSRSFYQYERVSIILISIARVVIETSLEEIYFVTKRNVFPTSKGAIGLRLNFSPLIILFRLCVLFV